MTRALVAFFLRQFAGFLRPLVNGLACHSGLIFYHRLCVGRGGFEAWAPQVGSSLVLPQLGAIQIVSCFRWETRDCLCRGAVGTPCTEPFLSDSSVAHVFRDTKAIRLTIYDFSSMPIRASCCPPQVTYSRVLCSHRVFV